MSERLGPSDLHPSAARGFPFEPDERPAVTTFAPFWLSLRVAGLAAVAIVAVGTPLSLALARGRFPGKGVLTGVLTLPLVLPPTVLGFLLLQALGRRAPLGAWLERVGGITIAFSPTGAVVASAVAAFPLFLLPARGAFEAVDPGLEDAARLLGRSERSVFVSITLPLAWRGLVAGAVLAFARALGDFGATLMLAGDIPGRTRTASLALYAGWQSGRPADLAAAWTLAALLAGVSIAAVLLGQRATRPAGPRPGDGR